MSGACPQVRVDSVGLDAGDASRARFIDAVDASKARFIVNFVDPLCQTLHSGPISGRFVAQIYALTSVEEPLIVESPRKLATAGLGGKKSRAC